MVHVDGTRILSCLTLAASVGNRRVAIILGNTNSVCRKCYVHPHVIEAFIGGSLGDSIGKI